MAQYSMNMAVRDQGVLRVLTMMDKKMSKMQGSMARTNKYASGMSGLMGKVGNRLLIAGGAALGFQATIGTITGMFQKWNEELDKSRQKLSETGSAVQNLMQMMPAGAAARAFPKLIQEAYVSPLTLPQLAAIRTGVYSLMTPEKGFTEEQRTLTRQAAGAFVRARGMPAAGITEALGKMQITMPGYTARQQANMMSVLMTQAAFIEGRLEEMLPQMTKVTPLAGTMGMDAPTMYALMTRMTEIAGEPSIAMRGLRGILTTLTTDERVRRRLGLTGRETPSEMFFKMQSAGLTIPELTKAGFGKRDIALAAGLFAPEGWKTVEAMIPVYRRAARYPGLMEEEEWEKRLTAVPYMRRWEEQRTAAEQVELKGLAPLRVGRATLAARREAFIESVTEAGLGSLWQRRLLRQVIYPMGYVAAAMAGEEDPAAAGTEFMARYVAGVSRVQGGDPEEVGRRYRTHITATGEVPPLNNAGVIQLQPEGER